MAAKLATVNELQEWLGLDGIPSTTSTLLASCLDRAERHLADIAGRPGDDPWVSGTRTEYLDGELATGILLTYTPVTAVSAVTVITGADSAGTETGSSIGLTRLAVDGYPIGGTFSALVGLLHFRNTGRERILGFEWGEPIGYASIDPGPAFEPGHYRVKVAYTGGVSASTVPAQLKQAVLETAAEMFGRSGRNTAPDARMYESNMERVEAWISPYRRRRA